MTQNKEMAEPHMVNWIGYQAKLSANLNKATAEDFIYPNKVIRKVKLQPVTTSLWY